MTDAPLLMQMQLLIFCTDCLHTWHLTVKIGLLRFSLAAGSAHNGCAAFISPSIRLHAWHLAVIIDPLSCFLSCSWARSPWRRLFHLTFYSFTCVDPISFLSAVGPAHNGGAAVHGDAAGRPRGVAAWPCSGRHRLRHPATVRHAADGPAGCRKGLWRPCMRRPLSCWVLSAVMFSGKSCSMHCSSLCTFRVSFAMRCRPALCQVR